MARADAAARTGRGVPRGSWYATILVLAFLHVPFALIVLYAFNVEEAAFTFPPPGLTTQWFAEA